jgi:photosystem II stability/assembly factor-like uncharacterized protein
MIVRPLVLALVAVLAASPLAGASAGSTQEESRLKAETFSGLEFRSIGPAMNSGRIGDLAIHPSDPNTWYVAVASGGVWKTINAGTTWSPIFDKTGSYSIGCVTVDPLNPLTVWVGTGENNSQRSVGYGDGVYKSVDGGRNWENVGLKGCEHVGKILVDPRDSNIVFVAAQGPLWAKGGDRGLYRTEDGGKTWKAVLEIDAYTGVSDVIFEPGNPDVMYASSYQRQRRVWTLIDGGPGSALYKSDDAGATWRKLENGLPKGDLGRTGFAISPANPKIVYALVEAADTKKDGFYRSTDAGGNWEKMSDYQSQSPQYYQEIYADPHNPDRVYSMDTWMHVTEDGGKTFRKVGETFKHVDNHALWINPDNTDHLIAGCDGGLYQTFDRGATWAFSANLPITQFYKVCADSAAPFYSVYGGTQDNNTLGGPSRTITNHGIMNSDWFITVGGDGFQSQVDPVDPNIVYSQWQHAGLVRYDRRSGEAIDIQPMAEPGEAPLRWNWDSPLVLSPHSPTRLYIAAQRIFRTDDRGDSWRPVSPDLSRQLDRNRLKIMDRVWSIDAVAKNASTSHYGNIVSLTESPLAEGLLYAGTDDGLVQVSEDGGGSWRKTESFPGVPELSYVSRLTASLHDVSTVYAAFDNHKMGDFKPYVLKSADRGRSWKSIAGDLPERGTVYALVEDHVNPDLLFAGTEFGVFFTADGGKRWIQLNAGIPVIAVRDLAIQRRESDLVAGTFGRGFYILDDYSPLRSAPAVVDSASTLFPVKPAWMFIQSSPMGGREKASLGDAFFTAPNPPFGAIFTYYLRDEIKTRAEKRRDTEKELIKAGKDVFYPDWDSVRVEEREEEPAAILTVTDDAGNVVRRLTGPVTKGFHRVAWDLRYPAAEPISLKPREVNPWDEPPAGPLASPGEYRVSLSLRVDGKVKPVAGPQAFDARPLVNATLPARDRGALLAFQKETQRLQRAVLGAVQSAREAKDRLAHLKKAIDDTPGADPTLADDSRALDVRLTTLLVSLSGDDILSRHNEPTQPSIASRVRRVVEGHWTSTSDATKTHHRAYEVAAAEFTGVLAQLRTLVETDLRGLEERAEKAGAPWTPGRVPEWKPE